MAGIGPGGHRKFSWGFASKLPEVPIDHSRAVLALDGLAVMYHLTHVIKISITLRKRAKLL